MPEQANAENNFADSFSKVLNRNGFGFHYSVINKARELSEKKTSHFFFEVSEFPVQVQGADTRIDFILRRHFGNGKWGQSLFLIAECKRVNPAYSNWFFVKSPFITRNPGRYDKHFMMETLRRNDEDGNIVGFVRQAIHLDSNYHIGLDVKTSKTGDPQGEMGDAIEKASAQVLRGMNGFIQTVHNENNLWAGGYQASFLPVIFTTADLFISETDISQADLQDGKINLTNDQIQKVNWLYFQYPMSLGLKHSILFQGNTNNLSELLYKDHIRTIAVVSADGIEDFLLNMTQMDFED